MPHKVFMKLATLIANSLSIFSLIVLYLELCTVRGCQKKNVMVSLHFIYTPLIELSVAASLLEYFQKKWQSTPVYSLSFQPTSMFSTNWGLKMQLDFNCVSNNKVAGKWCFQSCLSFCSGKGVPCYHYPWCIGPQHIGSPQPQSYPHPTPETGLHCIAIPLALPPPD